MAKKYWNKLQLNTSFWEHKTVNDREIEHKTIALKFLQTNSPSFVAKQFD